MTRASQSGEVGKTYGRLTLVEELHHTKSHVYYRCKCICGGEAVATCNNLRKGNTKSCGCWISGIKYSPKTGLMYNRGTPVLGVGKNGYMSTSYKGERFYIHRLAWLLMTGEPVPKGLDIDHINRIRTDNRFENLRVVTRRENLLNCAPRTNQLTGREAEVWGLHLQGIGCTEMGRILGIDRHKISDFIKSKKESK